MREECRVVAEESADDHLGKARTCKRTWMQEAAARTVNMEAMGLHACCMGRRTVVGQEPGEAPLGLEGAPGVIHLVRLTEGALRSQRGQKHMH